MPTSEMYVTTNEYGVMHVQNSRVTLDSLVLSFLEGHSPEAIRAQYPVLTLEQVYGAITYYLAHRDEVEAYLKRQEEVWKQLRAKVEANPSPVVDRLRALMRAEATVNK